MADRAARVDLGFQGGQVLALRLQPAEYEALRKALDGEGRWHDLKAEDSSVSVDLGQVVYLRLDTEQQRVGF